MRILLLHDDIYLPSLGGGVKVNRCLMEELSLLGHECEVISHALTRSQDGPDTVERFQSAMDARNVAVAEVEQGVFSFRFRQVAVNALLDETSRASQDYIESRLNEFQPDIVLVTEDKRQILLGPAIAWNAQRVVLLLQTLTNLPFGPLSIRADDRQFSLMCESAASLVISQFLQKYICEHSPLRPEVIPIPVFGEIPCETTARFGTGAITMINPCEIKGVAVFQALAHAFPEIPFAAVPTWGANAEQIAELRALPNMRLLKPSDDVGEVLCQARMLVAPSMWPETFGLVVPEAMLRGIPVLASDHCGLREAKLGVDYLFPIQPAIWDEPNWHCPEQDPTPWIQVVQRLLTDSEEYHRVSRESSAAAHAYVERIDVRQVEAFFDRILGRQASGQTCIA